MCGQTLTLGGGGWPAEYCSGTCLRADPNARPYSNRERRANGLVDLDPLERCRKRYPNRTPPWVTEADIKQMKRLYRSAQVKHMEVDHIIPLRGKNVSGLNVPWNLQLLAPEINRKKGNAIWDE
jgi:5-methylcytosine-specific restriction endonuclease McrA